MKKEEKEIRDENDDAVTLIFIQEKKKVWKF